MAYDKDSLYSPKCLCGIPVVTVCSVFAVINIVIVGLLALGCIGLMAYVITFFVGPNEVNNSHQLFALIVWLLITAACYLGVGIATIFAVLLLLGMRRKKVKFVKAYLIYSIVVETCLVLSTLTYVGVKSQDIYYGGSWFIVFGTTSVFVCILYGSIVQLVYITYIVMKTTCAANPDVQMLCL